MDLPEYIKKAIRAAGKHSKIATENNNKVRNWLEKNTPDAEPWEDYLIDSLEQGIDSSEGLIAFLKNDFREDN